MKKKRAVRAKPASIWCVVTPRGQIFPCVNRERARLERMVFDAKRNPGEERSRIAKLVESK